MKYHLIWSPRETFFHKTSWVYFVFLPFSFCNNDLHFFHFQILSISVLVALLNFSLYWLTHLNSYIPHWHYQESWWFSYYLVFMEGLLILVVFLIFVSHQIKLVLISFWWLSQPIRKVFFFWFGNLACPTMKMMWVHFSVKQSNYKVKQTKYIYIQRINNNNSLHYQI